MSNQQDPNNPNWGQPYPPQGYAQPMQPQKNRNPWKFGFIGCGLLLLIPIVIIGIVIIVAVSGTSSDNADNEATGPVNVGETVHMKKADITTSNFRNSGADPLGNNNVCADVSVVNTSEKDTINLNGLTDWKLTDPNGVTASQGISAENDYDPVTLQPGGHKDGTVCFESNAPAGEYTLEFTEGLSFSNEKAVWKTSL